MNRIHDYIIGKSWVKVLIDIVSIILGFFIALALRFEFSIPQTKIAHLLLTLPGIIIVFTFFNVVMGIYSGKWKYASFDELLNLSSATFFSTTIIFLVTLFVPGVRGYLPLSVAVIGGIVSLFVMSFARTQYRILTELSLRRREIGGKRVLLVGAGEAGEIVARDMMRHPDYGLSPVGFIDDNKSKGNLQVQGIPVLGGRETIPENVRKLDVDQIFITIPSMEGIELRDIITICETTDAEIKILPPILKTISGRIGAFSVRELCVEDLLGREPFDLDVSAVSSAVTGKCVVVTGGSGSIGSVLAQHLASFGPKRLIALDNSESGLFSVENDLKRRFPECDCKVVMADIRDEGRINKLFHKYHPDLIFHTAASKHVPMMEMYPTEAIKNNVLGTKILAEAARDSGASAFILYSSIKAEKPDNIMGVTKHIAEELLYYMNSDGGCRFASFRLGNVLGTRGSVIEVFQRLIEQGGPINLTHPDASRYFLTIDEAALMTMQTVAFMDGGEIFMPDMGEPVKIKDLAENMIGFMRPGEVIKINITGLRPGEKAQEDLLLPVDIIKPTAHEKILRLDYHFQGKEEFIQEVKELIEAAYRNDEVKVKKLLAKLALTYTPKGLEEEEAMEKEEEKRPELRVVKEEEEAG